MQPERALAEMGFTELEARLYCELLRASPATGYRLSQIVGKAPANVYQALASMSQKGIVVADDDETKHYRAIAPAEVLEDLRQDFDRRRVLAEEALKKVFAPPERDRIYQVRTPQQVMDRARAMIEAARTIVLFDLGPELLEVLGPSLTKASASGVTVAGVTYAPTPDLGFPCVETVGAAYRDRLPGQPLTVVVDAREYLMAHLSRDGAQVLHGVWSDSPYLACVEHSGLSCEIRLSALKVKDDPMAYVGLFRAIPEGPFELDCPGETGAAEQTSRSHDH
jgi:predicted transcriptional regulator